MIKESPSKFFLTVSGILKPRHAAHWSKILTDGAHILLVDRNFGKSSRNGSGIFAWSWDKTALPPHFAPRYLTPPANPHQRADPRQPTRHRQPVDPYQRACRRWPTDLRRPTNRRMAHLNGHDHPLPEGFPDQLFFPNRMGHCFAQPG